ncbi:probable basic-leucine zipper transcription factor K [Scylla paramamosain]
MRPFSLYYLVALVVVVAVSVQGQLLQQEQVDQHQQQDQQQQQQEQVDQQQQQQEQQQQQQQQQVDQQQQEQQQQQQKEKEEEDQCLPCSEVVCAKELEYHECPWGRVRDPCHCCDECAKGPGDVCGGKNGTCLPGFKCIPRTAGGGRCEWRPLPTFHNKKITKN